MVCMLILYSEKFWHIVVLWATFIIVFRTLKYCRFRHGLNHKINSLASQTNHLCKCVKCLILDDMENVRMCRCMGHGLLQPLRKEGLWDLLSILWSQQKTILVEQLHKCSNPYLHALPRICKKRFLCQKTSVAVLEWSFHQFLDSQSFHDFLYRERGYGYYNGLDFC